MVGTATTIDDRPRTRECDNSAHADNRVACEDNYSFGMENDPTQGAANIIHMANVDGESNDAIFDKCFNIAALGCSSGTNTLLSASNIIDMVHEACEENNRTTPQFQITTTTFFQKGDDDEADVVQARLRAGCQMVFGLAYDLKLCRLTFVLRVRSATKMHLAQMFGCLARVRVDSGNNEMVCVVACHDGLGYPFVGENGSYLRGATRSKKCLQPWRTRIPFCQIFLQSKSNGYTFPPIPHILGKMNKMDLEIVGKFLGERFKGGGVVSSDSGVLRGAGISALAGAVLFVEVLKASRAYCFRALSATRNLSMADSMEELLRGRFIELNY
ncbi:benzoate carboxyl methyltransferase-like protein [Tanacetum coccineum]